MTEDDTIRILKRPTFDWLWKEWKYYTATNAEYDFDKWIPQYGWTADEFHKEHTRRYKLSRGIV